MPNSPVATSGDRNSNSKLCWRLIAAKASKQMGPQIAASVGTAVRIRVGAWLALGMAVSFTTVGAETRERPGRTGADYTGESRAAKRFLWIGMCCQCGNYIL